jgi:hypothetical protein
MSYCCNHGLAPATETVDIPLLSSLQDWLAAQSLSVRRNSRAIARMHQKRTSNPH